MSRTFYGGGAFPFIDSHIGPGSLATFIGSQPHFQWNTVWYEPCIADPDAHPQLRFDPSNEWFHKHVAILEEAVRSSNGRYLVSMPDLIENIDIKEGKGDRNQVSTNVYYRIRRNISDHEKASSISAMLCANKRACSGGSRCNSSYDGDIRAVTCAGER